MIDLKHLRSLCDYFILCDSICDSNYLAGSWIKMNGKSLRCPVESIILWIKSAANKKNQYNHNNKNIQNLNHNIFTEVIAAGVKLDHSSRHNHNPREPARRESKTHREDAKSVMHIYQKGDITDIKVKHRICDVVWKPTGKCFVFLHYSKSNLIFLVFFFCLLLRVSYISKVINQNFVRGWSENLNT